MRREKSKRPNWTNKQMCARASLGYHTRLASHIEIDREHLQSFSTAPTNPTTTQVASEALSKVRSTTSILKRQPDLLGIAISGPPRGHGPPPAHPRMNIAARASHQSFEPHMNSLWAAEGAIRWRRRSRGNCHGSGRRHSKTTG